MKQFLEIVKENKTTSCRRLKRALEKAYKSFIIARARNERGIYRRGTYDAEAESSR